MTKDEALKLALTALEINQTLLEKITPYKGQEDLLSDSIDITQNTTTAIKEALARPEFTKHEVVSAEDWSEWVCPDPQSYLMKCCDCGLVHEAQFKVVRYKSEDDREDCDMVDDPNLQAVFRMRRSEQWLPEDTAHRAGGLPMAQPEQTNIERHEANVKKFLGAPQPEQEPVAWTLLLVGEHHGIIGKAGETFATSPEHYRRVDVYTTPPQRKPLTDEQIDEEFKLYASKFDTSSDKWLDMGADDYFKAGFKAAHGIKENKHDKR